MITPIGFCWLGMAGQDKTNGLDTCHGAESGHKGTVNAATNADNERFAVVVYSISPKP